MEALATTNNQIICSYCEELVHRYAVRCPYCQHELKPSLPTGPAVQLELPNFPTSAQVTALHEEGSSDEEVSSRETPDVPTLHRVLLPLLALLTGSFFAVFALILRLFSKHGVFTLSWNSDNWLTFLLPSFLFLAIGCFTLSFADHEN